MLKAKDVMTKELICIKKDSSIYETLQLLAQNDITDIPVVEDDMTLAGILSEKGALKLFCGRTKDKTVNDFITQPAVRLEQDESLLDVYDCLINNSFRQVPVTAKGKLVGIISRKDIIRHILRFNCKTEPAFCTVDSTSLAEYDFL